MSNIAALSENKEGLKSARTATASITAHVYATMNYNIPNTQDGHRSSFIYYIEWSCQYLAIINAF